MSPSDSTASLGPLLEYVRQSRGLDFSVYKNSTLARRIAKRLQAVDAADSKEYIDYLEVHPEEFTALFNTILINVTSFFRDKPAWDYLTAEIIPRILSGRGANNPVRVWSAGCSSGEEAYTLALVFCEALGLEVFRSRVKIYATDIDAEALIQARSGRYTRKELESVPEDFLEKYFEPVGNTFVLKPALRCSVVFGRHDLVQDAPISRMDLLVCRNTLMYFNAEVQARVLTRFHYALNDNGYLFLGKAEMALSTGRLFAPVDSRLRIFLKVPGINVRERIIALGPPAEPAAPPDLTARERLRAMAYEAAPGAEIMVDYSGHLALFNSQARSLSGLGAKDLEQPLQNLDVSHSPAELKPLIQKAIADRQPVTVRNLEYSPREGPVQYLDLEVKPLFGDDDQPLGAGLTFMDASRSHGFLEEIQRTRQEQETASEELQSSNEELRTMNDELRQRTDDLNQTHGFMESILSGVRVGIIVVDPDLKVILWNEGAKELWGLGAEEVRGKSLLDLDIGLPVDKLVEPIKASLTEAGLFKRILVDAVNRRGRPFKCRVTLTGSLGPKLERRGLVLVMEEE